MHSACAGTPLIGSICCAEQSTTDGDGAANGSTLCLADLDEDDDDNNTVPVCVVSFVVVATFDIDNVPVFDWSSAEAIVDCLVLCCLVDVLSFDFFAASSTVATTSPDLDAAAALIASRLFSHCTHKNKS